MHDSSREYELGLDDELGVVGDGVGVGVGAGAGVGVVVAGVGVGVERGGGGDGGGGGGGEECAHTELTHPPLSHSVSSAHD